MANKEIAIIAGPCAVETYEQTMGMAYKVSLLRDAVEPFGIKVGFRGGAWKPRTLYWTDEGEKVFEGTREEGLGWLSEVGKAFGLFIVTECMSEDDWRHFGRYLEPERDYIQIGARNSQNFALLYAVGGTAFNVLLKNPQHGVNVTEAIGSLQRLEKNGTKIYCTRGQQITPPDGKEDEAYLRYKSELYQSQIQDPDSRNLNNIEAILILRENPYFAGNGILLVHDPSHTWGGRNDRIRRKIGEFAIRAITEYGYDGIMVDVCDKSSFAKCDGDQALLTTSRNVDWSKTNAGQGPGVRPNTGREPEIMPITLVDIASSLIDYQAERMNIDLYDERVMLAKKKLQEISWDMVHIVK